MKQRVAVGLSGGVDSAVSALVLKQMGYEVVGVHLYCWPPKSEVERDGMTREEWIKKNGCRADEDREMALKTALELGIQFKVLDFSEEYNQRVIRYFYDEYEKGRTPNPDVMCNSEIKFGLFLEWAMENGFDFIATGHYARLFRIEKNDSAFYSHTFSSDEIVLPAQNFSGTQGENFTLKSKNQALHTLRNPDSKDASKTQSNLEGSSNLSLRSMAQGLNSLEKKPKLLLTIPEDKHKDQTYFLWKLTQKELSHVLFPLGEYKKPTVRKMAQDAGLSVAGRADSQGICFVGSVDVREFLQRRLKPKLGVVKDINGEVVGEHDGVWFYTIGQRGGWRISAKAQRKYTKDEETPIFYVVSKDAKNNELVVGREGEVEKNGFEVSELNWILGEKILGMVKVRIRHGGEMIDGILSESVSGVKVVLNKEIRGIASGQSAVFYSTEGEMLGGGVIV